MPVTGELQLCALHHAAHCATHAATEVWCTEFLWPAAATWLPIQPELQDWASDPYCSLKGVL